MWIIVKMVGIIFRRLVAQFRWCERACLIEGSPVVRYVFSFASVEGIYEISIKRIVTLVE
jgi:hypothetical protein